VNIQLKISTMHIFVYPPTRNALYDLGLMIFEAITLNQSIHCSISTTLNRDDVNVILGSHCIPYDQLSMIPDNSIIWNLEHLYDGSQWLDDKYKFILKKYKVWDFSENNIKYLREKLNVEAKIVKFGYTRLLKNIPSEVEESIDVLFYGGIYGKRVEYITQIRAAGINIVVGPNSFWGKVKADLISKAKIVLNLHLYNGGFEAPRVYHLLNNKKFVISEASINDHEYTSIADGFVRVEMGNINAMISEIKYYLQHPTERREIAETGYTSLKLIKTVIPDY